MQYMYFIYLVSGAEQRKSGNKHKNASEKWAIDLTNQ